MVWSLHPPPSRHRRLSFYYPRELVVRRHPESANSLYVAVNGGSLSIGDHLDGEGYTCNLPIAKLTMKRTKEADREIASTSGSFESRRTKLPVHNI